MDGSTFAFFTLLIGIPIFIYQRTEAKKRLIVLLVMLIPAELIRRYVWYRDVHTEAWIALIIALVINFLFWALIGRYNPVGSSDRIQVIGMDD